MPGVSVKDKVVLVSASNRGIGKSFATQALTPGARKSTLKPFSTYQQPHN